MISKNDKVINSSNTKSNTKNTNKTQFLLVEEKRLSNNIAELMGVDDSTPPPLPPLSAPPPLD